MVMGRVPVLCKPCGKNCSDENSCRLGEGKPLLSLSSGLAGIIRKRSVLFSQRIFGGPTCGFALRNICVGISTDLRKRSHSCELLRMSKRFILHSSRSFILDTTRRSAPSFLMNHKLHRGVSPSSLVLHSLPPHLLSLKLPGLFRIDIIT